MQDIKRNMVYFKHLIRHFYLICKQQNWLLISE